MKDQQNNSQKNPSGEDKKTSLNVLHREPNAPTAGVPDREPASGEESAEGKLRGAANPSVDKGKPREGGALNGLDQGETWENDSIDQKKASPGATPEGQKDQQTR